MCTSSVANTLWNVHILSGNTWWNVHILSGKYSVKLLWKDLAQGLLPSSTYNQEVLKVKAVHYFTLLNTQFPMCRLLSLPLFQSDEGTCRTYHSFCLVTQQKLFPIFNSFREWQELENATFNAHVTALMKKMTRSLNVKKSQVYENYIHKTIWRFSPWTIKVAEVMNLHHWCLLVPSSLQYSFPGRRYGCPYHLVNLVKEYKRSFIKKIKLEQFYGWLRWQKKQFSMLTESTILKYYFSFQNFTKPKQKKIPGHFCLVFPPSFIVLKFYELMFLAADAMVMLKHKHGAR